MEWLKKNKETCPNSFFIDEFTYRDIYQKVVTLARKLSYIVAKEERVAIYAGNSLETLLFIQALLLLNKEVLLLNVRLKRSEVENQTKKLGVKLIFSSKDAYLSFTEIETYPENETHLYWQINPNKIAVIMNTSATNGEFKSVPIRWKQIEEHVRASSAAVGVDKNDRWLLVLPIFHISGLSILFRSLYNGTQLTIMENFNEDELVRLVNEKKINMLSIVPTMLKKISNHIKEHCLRVVLLGGEFIPDQLVKNAVKKKIPIFKTYGMTEHASQITTFSVLDFPEKLASVGQALGGVSIYIHNKDENGIGEIWVKSPMLMDGYIGHETMNNNYFNTCDIGFFDSDSFMYVLSRRDDIIISGGENIYPKEIEDLLYKLPEVEECVVVKKKDSEWGEVPILYIVSKIARNIIKEYLEERLAKYKIPKQFIYVNELPKNDSGKINKKILGRE